jgi:AI-2 transport protein TqsA
MSPFSPTPLKESPRLLLTAASLVVVVAGLKAGKPLFVPIVLALFLAVLSVPVLGLLRRRLPVGVAVALTVLFDCTVLAVFAYVLSIAVTRVTERAPIYQEQFQAFLDQALAWLSARGVEAGEWVSPESIGPGPLVDLVSTTFLGVATLVSALVIVLLLLLFMLYEVEGFSAKMRRAVGIEDRQLARYTKITREVQRYLVIKTLMSLATGVSVGVWVHLVGLDFPFLLGLIAFVLNYVPNIGSILAAVPGVALALVQLSVPRMLLIVLGYAVINLWWGNLVEPHVMGRQLKISPLAVFVSLLFWGYVWGIMGMLLAVPITMVLKILFENSERLRWLGLLLDPPTREASG